MPNETCALCITFGQGLNTCTTEEDASEAIPQILSRCHAWSSAEDSMCGEVYVTSTMDHVKRVQVYKMVANNFNIIRVATN
jgi:hypothetical protein